MNIYDIYEKIVENFICKNKLCLFPDKVNLYENGYYFTKPLYTSIWLVVGVDHHLYVEIGIDHKTYIFRWPYDREEFHTLFNNYIFDKGLLGKEALITFLNSLIDKKLYYRNKYKLS
jgi:hypothetical protein